MGIGSDMGGDKKEAQRASRVNGNMQLPGIGVGRGENLQKIPEAWDVKGSQDAMQQTLVEMLNSVEMEPEETTFTRQTWSSVEG